MVSTNVIAKDREIQLMKGKSKDEALAELALEREVVLDVERPVDALLSNPYDPYIWFGSDDEKKKRTDHRKRPDDEMRQNVIDDYTE